MQIYLVGGAVRDKLLMQMYGWQQQSSDCDYVVVGANAEELSALGFVQVGRDFPVFLHPKTTQEYALARLEKKTGVGHTAFGINSDKTVSLKEDLYRRDLTINALAIEVGGLFDDKPIGEVVDYYGGLEDLHNKTLRHISDAFCEDPLRVLRVARFYARFFDLGFVVHQETLALMQKIVQSGEMSTLSAERIWAESLRATCEECGFAYWQFLFDHQILEYILPILNTHWQNHNATDEIRQLVFAALKYPNASALAKFAFLTLGLSKGEQKQLAKALCMPKAYTHFIDVFDDYKDKMLLSSGTIIELIERTKARHNDTMLMQLLEAICVYKNLQDTDVHQFNHLQAIFTQAVQIYQSIGINDIDKSLTGQAIGRAIYEQKFDEVNKLLAKTIKLSKIFVTQQQKG